MIMMLVLFDNFAHMKLDMHFHSTASDGNTPGEQLLQMAQQRGITHAFLTDHDRVSKKFASMAKKSWIFSAESVEISARNEHNNFSLHIALYAQKIEGKILSILENTLTQKKNLLKKQIQKFQEIWCEIDMEEFYDFYQKNWRTKDSLVKFDIAYFLLQNQKNRNIIENISGKPNIEVVEFFTSFMKKEGEKFEEFWVRIPEYEATLEDCREAKIHNNGILSLVHPNFTFRKWIQHFHDQLPEYIKNAGINAIEINSKATKDWVEAILEAQKKYDLYLTFGSDCHRVSQPDEKHEDFWVMNPYVLEQYGKEFIQKEFEKYAHFLEQ